MRPIRLAIVVSHPIQYYVPLYQRLARRDDIEVKVFFTWHAGQDAVLDHGFKQNVAWDIPLTQGYAFELVANTSVDPGTHTFFGLRNPTLVECVMAWQPDAVHLTGWAWFSHLLALRSFHRLGVTVLFRGDSHLLDSPRCGFRWWVKHRVLRHVYSWPKAFLYVGTANRAYYEAFGIKPDRLVSCPHSIDVGRFAEPAEKLDQAAADWRCELDISVDQVVLLFAGKFEPKKRPLELMRAIQEMDDPRVVLVMVGGGELADDIHAGARATPQRIRVLPFQNQSRMPLVYRLGDIFVLPSAYGETWGLGVTEAMACGRAAIVSDRVGCAADMVGPDCGYVFPWDRLSAMIRAVKELSADRNRLLDMGRAASARARRHDVSIAEGAVVSCLRERVKP